MNLGKKFPKMPDHISTFLAEMLFKSSDWGMAGKTEKWPHHDTAEKKKMVEKFVNKDLCNLTENFIFSYPFQFAVDIILKTVSYCGKQIESSSSSTC